VCNENKLSKKEGKKIMANLLHEWIGKSLLIGVFIICLITFGVLIGSNYGKTSTDMVGTSIDTGGIESAINKTNTDALAWKSAFESDSPLISLGILAIQSLWNTGLSMFNVILTLMDLYLFSISNIFGVPAIMTGAITTILIVKIIYMVCQWVKT
jgi:hypothetical protein